MHMYTHIYNIIYIYYYIYISYICIYEYYIYIYIDINQQFTAGRRDLPSKLPGGATALHVS